MPFLFRQARERSIYDLDPVEAVGVHKMKASTKAEPVRRSSLIFGVHSEQRMTKGLEGSLIPRFVLDSKLNNLMDQKCAHRIDGKIRLFLYGEVETTDVDVKTASFG